ncbi:MAG: preprotein translocase subunit YajC [Pirellulaceae bacterium]|nr:preprotein translocase subunit YajC [Planctomycetales bacterium]
MMPDLSLMVRLLAEEAEQTNRSPLPMYLMIGVIGLLWVVIMWLPQRKEQQRTQAMLGGLKKNDRVLLSSGIQGVVMQAQSDDTYIVVRVDESTGTKLKVLRSSVVRVVDDEKDA